MFEEHQTIEYSNHVFITEVTDAGERLLQSRDTTELQAHNVPVPADPLVTTDPWQGRTGSSGTANPRPSPEANPWQN